MQKSSMPPKFSMSDISGEQSLAKKARKLRDSWSFRSMMSSQGKMTPTDFARAFSER